MKKKGQITATLPMMGRGVRKQSRLMIQGKSRYRGPTIGPRGTTGKEMAGRSGATNQTQAGH